MSSKRWRTFMWKIWEIIIICLILLRECSISSNPNSYKIGVMRWKRRTPSGKEMKSRLIHIKGPGLSSFFLYFRPRIVTQLKKKNLGISPFRLSFTLVYFILFKSLPSEQTKHAHLHRIPKHTENPTNRRNKSQSKPFEPPAPQRQKANSPGMNARRW